MPTPATPTLTAAATSRSSFVATVSSPDAGATFRLYYRRTGAAHDESGGERVGPGDFSEVTGLQAHGHYTLWCQADDGGYLSAPAWSQVALSSPDLLSQAVHARFQSSAALAAAVPGGLWTGEVPEGASYPYAWLDVSRVDTHYNFVSRGEYARIGVHVYALGAESAETAMAAWKGHFDGCRLDYSDASGCVSLVVIPLSYSVRGENLRHPSGRLVFRATQTYHTITQRPR